MCTYLLWTFGAATFTGSYVLNRLQGRSVSSSLLNAMLNFDHVVMLVIVSRIVQLYFVGP